MVACTTFAACGKDTTGPGGGGTVVDSSAVAYIGLTGVPPSGKLYEGQFVHLTASLFDHRNRAVTGVPIAWWSTDTARAVVVGTGMVVARKAGDVKIWVESQDVRASVDLSVLRVPVHGVRITNGSFASYASLSTTLSADALDSVGGVLAGRTVTWASSNAHIVSVDGSGVATAHAEGTAAITATSEGKSASVNMRVLPRPASDWSRVSDDWRTYQGNARHTGYVPAVLDPVLFAGAWEKAPFGETPANPATAGDGRIYLSSQSYFASQKLAVLNATTGSQLWGYDFGGIHGVHPPAYADGVVYLTTSGHSDSFLWAFDAALGTIRFRSAYSNQWSRYYAPVVVDQTVYMAGGDTDGMYAFSAADGTQRWFKGLNQYDQWSPAVSDDLVYAYTGEYSPKVTVVHAATGATAYEIPDPQFSWDGWSMNIAPVLGGANNLLATQGGRLISFDLANRSIGWQIPNGFSGTPVVANGMIYVIRTGQIEARRESDGGLLWVWVPPAGSTLQGNMIATDNLLLVSTPSTTYAIDLTAKLSAWSYPLGGHLTLSAQGLLIITSGQSGTVAAIDLR